MIGKVAFQPENKFILLLAFLGQCAILIKKAKFMSSISELQSFIYDDSYVGQPQPRIATGAREVGRRTLSKISTKVQLN